MNSISSIASSGMAAAQLALDASASNIANAQTPAYRRLQVVQTAQMDGGVVATTTAADAQQTPALETDVVAQLQAKNAFLANLAVFKTGDKLAGTLLTVKA